MQYGSDSQTGYEVYLDFLFQHTHLGGKCINISAVDGVGGKQVHQ
jgi:hypothetical protein